MATVISSAFESGTAIAFAKVSESVSGPVNASGLPSSIEKGSVSVMGWSRQTESATATGSVNLWTIATRWLPATEYNFD